VTNLKFTGTVRRMIPKDWERMVAFFADRHEDQRSDVFEFLDGAHSERDYWIALDDSENCSGILVFDKKESRLPRIKLISDDFSVVTCLLETAIKLLHDRKGAAIFIAARRDDVKMQDTIKACGFSELFETHENLFFAYIEPCEHLILHDLYKKHDDYEIRRILPEDRPLIYDFFRAMGETSTGFFNRNHGNENGVYDYLDGKLPDRTYWMAVKKDNGKEICLGIVFICIKFTKLPGFGIAVRDGYHGMHIGTNLIEFVKEVCRANHCGGIMLTTAFTNEKGQRLYEHRGFQRSGIQCGEWFYICPLK